MSVTGVFSDRDSLDLIERDFIMPAIIKLGRPRRFVVSDLLRDLEFAAVLQIGRDAGRAEGMIANPRFDAGRFRPPADDAVGSCWKRGLCVSWPVLRRALWYRKTWHLVFSLALGGNGKR
jgi:hypothetical protein